MNSHVFITTKYLDKCLETGLFGVTATQINYLANVQIDDTVFLMETGSGRLIGPFSITNTLFHSSKPIWEKDTFVNRVTFKTDNAWESDIGSLWRVLLLRSVTDFYTFTTFQRSNVTLLPEEGQRLADAIASDGCKITPLLHVDIQKEQVDLILRDKGKFSSEARLEATLLMNHAEFLQVLVGEGLLSSTIKPFIINQVTLPGTNYNVDIVIFSGKNVVVVELKKDTVDRNTIDQLLRYGRYWELSGKEVDMVAIGNKVVGNHEKVNAFPYNINNRKLVLEIQGSKNSYSIPMQNAR